ncbi:MAG TPA: proline dehydrogenase family protein [Acidimicrobiales bacterium]|nr:proline dehydrogenase family protein [Acidimicrobiales bacterium]
MTLASADAIERDTQVIARALAAGRQKGGRDRLGEAAMGWVTRRPDLKTQLFRLVDVFPAATDSDDVLRHVVEYLEPAEIPRLLRTALATAKWMPGGAAITAAVARRSIQRMARQFIAGEDAAAAVAAVDRLWRSGSAATVDLLGEKTVTAAEADRYANRVVELLGALATASPTWPHDPLLEADDLGGLHRTNLSVKPTALAPHLHPLTAEEGLAEAKRRLRPILQTAVDRGAFVYLDMEHYDVKDLTLRLFRELLDEPGFEKLDAGVVVQAYLRDSAADLDALCSWAKGRPRPIGIRLVKGAYWDAETIVAEAEGWDAPVYLNKVDTDANYERCVAILHDAHGSVRPAFASHNLRSLAYAIAYARQVGIPDNGYELQMLYGMAGGAQRAIRDLGLRLRVYCPVGELLPGMAYLVRRLLENTANESFLRLADATSEIDDLLAPPRPSDDEPRASRPVTPRPTDALSPTPYEPEPLHPWRSRPARERFSKAVDLAASADPIKVTALIGGEAVSTAEKLLSVDPANIERTVAVSASCGATEANDAVAAAEAAQPAWADRPAQDRASVLFRAAEWMRQRRDGLAALEVFEAGKPWKEADADICEAIDFCEYYGREALRLAEGGAVQSPPGEDNRLGYRAKGVVAVISPWNFPLAIPCGMVTAALVTGNAVVLKPAEQTPAIAARLGEAFAAAGLPPGVLNIVPGPGETAGAALVRHPGVHLIVFTGSMQVGLSIVAEAASVSSGQRHVKRVIAEMGGKNALVVDADADLDQAVPAAVYSAFGFAGQKCSAASRLVVVDAVHDELIERLAGATRELIVAHPSEMGAQLGPVIDADAHGRLLATIEAAAQVGTIAAQGPAGPASGWFVPPTVVTDVDPHAPVATDEHFGPILTVLRARDFEHALALASDTPFALTGGVFSRSPVHIAEAARRLRAGNIYVNRSITGAIVGRQPFGGYGLSGVGSKAGGPDYLLQFVDPVTVTENTVRQGFAPAQAKGV